MNWGNIMCYFAQKELHRLQQEAEKAVALLDAFDRGEITTIHVVKEPETKPDLRYERFWKAFFKAQERK